MKNKCVIFFHQGWTDIINFLPIISINCKKYDETLILIREDSKPLIDFYISNLKNVIPIYLPKIELDVNGLNFLKKYGDHVFETYGVWDTYRTDEYKNSFFECNTEFFVRKFYNCYGFDYIKRVSEFEINRDHYLESETLGKFIEKYGKDYILTHKDIDRGLSFEVENKSHLEVNLNGISNVFFDYISVIQNAKEIHLIDSVWSNLIYLLDCKYNLFSHIPIYVYTLRGYDEMYRDPIKLKNWTIQE